MIANDAEGHEGSVETIIEEGNGGRVGLHEAGAG